LSPAISIIFKPDLTIQEIHVKASAEAEEVRLRELVDVVLKALDVDLLFPDSDQVTNVTIPTGTNVPIDKKDEEQAEKIEESEKNPTNETNHTNLALYKK
jgi:hypothetical protein